MLASVQPSVFASIKAASTSISKVSVPASLVDEPPSFVVSGPSSAFGELSPVDSPPELGVLKNRFDGTHSDDIVEDDEVDSAPIVRRNAVVAIIIGK